MTVSSDGSRLVKELAEVGVHVASVYDLVNTDSAYTEAIPVLLRYLLPRTDRRLQEGVVRALGVKEARGIAAGPLIHAFKADEGPGWTLRWAIGNSLYTVAESTDLPELLNIVRNSSYGRGREMIVATLARFDTPASREAVLALLRQDDLTLHAIDAAGKLGLTEAASILARYATDERLPIKKAALRALATLEKRRPR